MRTLLLWLFLSCATWAQTTLIRNVHVGAKLTEVWIAGDKIVAPSKHAQRTIDAQGGYLIPGFVNYHVHLGLVDPQQVVRGGVTTVRDLGFPLAQLRQMAQRDLTHGPTLIYSGGMLTCPGGYPENSGWAPRGTAIAVASPDQAESIVDSLVKAGAGCLKVTLEPGAGPTLPLPTLRAICQSAHRHRLKVTAHVSGLKELDKCLDAGVDDLAHGLFDSSSIPQATLERMVKQGMSMCPTLHINPHPARIDNLARFQRLGGRVLYGTDLGNAGPPPGIDIEEVRLLMRAGMTFPQVLKSATLGPIKIGAPADLVLLQGDPAADLANLGRIRAVWHRGAMLQGWTKPGRL